MLTHKRLLEVLEYNTKTGIFTWKVQLAPRGKMGAVAGCRGIRGRRSIRIDGTLYLAHRLAWFYVHGEWPVGGLDHENNEHSSDFIANLRAANQSQNIANCRKHKDNTSGIKGISWDNSRKKWRAAIGVGGEVKFLGRFHDKTDASEAYRLAAETYFGEFARIA